MRATKTPYPNDPNPEWDVGEFGLVECNDPSLRFKTTPVKVKDGWLNAKDSDAWFAARCKATDIQEEIMQTTHSMSNVLKLVHGAIGDISKYGEIDVPMAIMKVLHEAIESGFQTDAEANKEIEEEQVAAEAVSAAVVVAAN